MIIHYAEYDIETGRLLRLVAEPYSGPWALCKNDKSKKVMKESVEASKSAQAISKSQLALSNALINKDEKAFAAWLEGQGVPPEEIANLRSQFRNNISMAYGSAMGQVKQQIAARGGYQAGGFSGPDVSKLSGFQANQARSLAAGNLGIGIWANEQNAARKQFAGTLYGALAGTQAQTATGFGNIGANYMGTAQQAAARADQPSPLWGVLGRVAGAGASILTGGLASPLMGGIINAGNATGGAVLGSGINPIAPNMPAGWFSS